MTDQTRKDMELQDEQLEQVAGGAQPPDDTIVGITSPDDIIPNAR